MMLLGEHAVLYGHPCIVAAVNKQVCLIFHPRSDDYIIIETALGSYRCTRQAIAASQPLRFAVQALQSHKDLLQTGFNLNIESEFSDQLGLGSSAAVTVGVNALLDTAFGGGVSDHTLMQSINDIQSVQGCGSGADAAASFCGGIVRYCKEPVQYEKLPCHSPEFSLLYSGHKTPTPEVIRHVASQSESYTNLYVQLYELMHAVVDRGVEALRECDVAAFCRMMNMNQGLLDALGVCDSSLWEILSKVHNRPGVKGAKISGSGLGDCVVVSGDLGEWREPYKQHKVRISEKGVEIDVL